MDQENEAMARSAKVELEAAVARWDEYGDESPSVDFRLHAAQVEALISIAQSLAMLAKHANKLAQRVCD